MAVAVAAVRLPSHASDVVVALNVAGGCIKATAALHLAMVRSLKIRDYGLFGG
jgi:hypothetical protein